MYLSQHYLCAYCEARLIEDTHPAPRIDHWIPISHDPAQALDWTNLYLSCPRLGTCDDAKKETVPQEADGTLLPKPCEFDYQDHIGFTSMGQMYVRTDTQLTASFQAGLDEIIGEKGLCLNHPTLQAARKAAIDAERTRIEKRFSGRHATDTDREAIAAEHKAMDRWISFISIRVSWLRKTLGKGQPALP
jgi:uncharacterized protein (TIGR02646 family)